MNLNIIEQFKEFTKELRKGFEYLNLMKTMI